MIRKGLIAVFVLLAMGATSALTFSYTHFFFVELVPTQNSFVKITVNDGMVSVLVYDSFPPVLVNDSFPPVRRAAIQGGAPTLRVLSRDETSRSRRNNGPGRHWGFDFRRPKPYGMCSEGYLSTLEFSGWVVPAVLLAYPVFSFVRRRLRRRGTNCVKCGYDLTGNVSGVCPECGAKVSETT